MSTVLSAEQLEALRQIDTATMTNAIDHTGARPASAGFASLELQCLMPDLPPMVGYAVTATADSSTPVIPGRRSRDRELHEAIRDSPKPAVVVFQNVGADRLRSNHFGDIMVTTFNRLGAVGAVSDAGIRDLAGMRRRAPDFQMFAAGAVPAGGVSFVVDVGVTVSICGLTIHPGDLLHGDANGLITVPLEVVDDVVRESERVLAKEQRRVDFILSEEFSLERLAEMSGW